ncbi:MAG: hypothetical protein ACI9WU_005512, partial [Myxococcota bacterium]
ALAAKPPVETLVERGTRCYDELNYGCALARFREAAAAIEAGAEVTPAQRLTLYKSLAFTLASVEKHAEAQKAFEQCFAARPSFKLDPRIVSPKIYGDYQKARRRVLRSLVQGELNLPGLPDTYAPAPPTPDDFLLHVPAEVALAGGLDPESDLPVEMEFLAGARLLFGDDADAYGPGFGLGLSVIYQVTDIVGVGIVTLFSQHAYSGDDLKTGFPGTLYILDAGPTVRALIGLGDWVQLSIGFAAGIGTAGLANVSDAVGGWLAMPVGVTANPAREFGIGVSLMPSVVIATKADEEVAWSFTLPIFLHFEAHF